MKTYAALALAIFGAASVTSACNIPVFRYALERWRPDESEVIVYFDSSLGPEASAVVERWRMQSNGFIGTADSSTANAKVSLVDARSKDESDHASIELWNELSKESDAQLPHVLVRTKLGQGFTINHWHGTVMEAESVGLFDSPARTELKRRLLAGESIVWLMIASSDPTRNQAVRQLIRETLPSLDRKIKLPEGIGLPGSELYSEIPLLLKFSVLEIAPDDPQEAFLIQTLTKLRSSEFSSGEPLLIPVFGRGRALEVIPGDDMSESLIEDLTLFLSGACSCQVKEQNPGFDLLMTAAWEDQLFDGEESRPPGRSEEEGKNRPPVLLTIPPGRR